MKFATNMKTVTDIDTMMFKLRELVDARSLQDPDFRFAGLCAPQWRQAGNARYYTAPHGPVVAVIYGSGPHYGFGSCHFNAEGIKEATP